MKTAILGASGLVGRTMLRLLADDDGFETKPRLLVSARSAGTVLPYRGGELTCQEVSAEGFAGVDVALFSAGAAASRRWAPVARAAGAWVVDNSSAWRQDSTVPLVVPEINGDLVRQCPTNQIVANPNCSTIQIAMAVAPLRAAFGLREVQVTTFQAMSGAGQAGIAALTEQIRAGRLPDDQGETPGVAFDVVPAIGQPDPDGSFDEEAKVGRELRKILGRGPELRVSCTAVRVPVFNGHSAAVRVVLEHPFERAAVIEALSQWPGLVVAAQPHDFATAAAWSGRREVHVGRIRGEADNPHALLMWVVADNLLKGAALNAVQIAGVIAERV